MQTWLFTKDKKAKRVSYPLEIESDQFLWVSLSIDELDDFLDGLAQREQFFLHQEHYEDCFNIYHPCFFDALSDYKFLVYHAVDGRKVDDISEVHTQRAVFILRKQMLISVEDDLVARGIIEKRLSDPSREPPIDPEILLYQLLVEMTDQFLVLRNTLSAQYEQWQDQLLDEQTRFKQWSDLLSYKTSMQRLYRLADSQFDAISAWEEATETEFVRTGQAGVHLADLSSHIRRCVKFAQQIQSQLDALMQLHYSLMTSQTNRVVQVLTVISAIFLPLTLITGIFGMNFKNMPPLDWGGGFYLFLGVMVCVVLGLLIWFRSKRWI